MSTVLILEICWSWNKKRENKKEILLKNLWLAISDKSMKNFRNPSLFGMNSFKLCKSSLLPRHKTYTDNYNKTAKNMWQVKDSSTQCFEIW